MPRAAPAPGIDPWGRGGQGRGRMERPAPPSSPCGSTELLWQLRPPFSTEHRAAAAPSIAPQPLQGEEEVG